MRAARGPRAGAVAAAGGVAGLTLLSRALGFLRWVVQATTVGAGTVAGAYATANQVPNVLYEVVVGGALSATVVPVLASTVASGRREETGRTASGLLGLVLAVLVPAGAVLALAAGPVASLFPTSQGADPALQRDLVAAFLRMFALQVPLYGVGVVLTGVLQAHQRFTWPALTPVLSSLVVMATYAVFGAMTRASADGAASREALLVLGWGTTAGVAALSLPLLVPARRLGLRLRPTLRLDRVTAARVGRLGGAGVLTLLAQQASVLAVLALARSGGRTGTVAVYQYTQAVYVLPYAVLAVPVATVLYPRLAAAWQGAATGPARREEATRLTATATATVTAVATAGAGTLLAASSGAERFFALLADVTGMGTALAVLAPGLVGYALVYQVTRVLFAADRARGAAAATTAGWLTVVGVSVLTVRLASPHGGDGAATLVALGVGQSAGMLVAGAGLLLVLARHAGAACLAPSLRALAVGAPVAALAGAGTRWTSTLPASSAACVALAVLGALVTGSLVLLAVHLADPSLLGALGRRRASGPSTPPPPPAQTEEPS